MFRHLRAILRERPCHREYVKTKAAMYCGLIYFSNQLYLPTPEFV
jgi:hypothetical protein